MQKIKSHLLLLLILPVVSFAQEETEELINWSKSKLVWSDYKGAPNPDSDAAAATTTYLGIEYDISEKGFKYKIQCRFSKTKSWGRSKTDYILAHEQGHFDIAEIFARKLNKEMSQYKFDKDSFRKDLKSIYDKVNSDKISLQSEYDKETDHSRKKEEQTKWLKKIADKLEELKDYSGY